jgi:hypothetical protein
LVKYCNRECQIAHRPQHKKECKKQAEHLLFQEHPPREECPICMLPLPLGASIFQVCCGKRLCNGCFVGQTKEEVASGKALEHIGSCPFCREPDAGSDEEAIERIEKLMKKNNGQAFIALGARYQDGDFGLEQNMTKAMDLYLKAGELGYCEGFTNLGFIFYNGLNGVEVNKKQAKQYLVRAVMMGNVQARRLLAVIEDEEGNTVPASRHFLLAARAGDEKALEMVKRRCEIGLITNKDYSAACKLCQQRQDEMKSSQRDEAERENSQFNWLS